MWQYSLLSQKYQETIPIYFHFLYNNDQQNKKTESESFVFNFC